jgi:UDP-N-acetylmuramoylalanine--D-glutamate ligase
MAHLDLRGRRVLVVGMAASGRAAARLAVSAGARVHLTDQKPGLAPEPGCTATFGHHDDRDFAEADLIIVSPGVPAAHPALAAAAARGAEVVGELGFAAQVVQAHGVPLLGITGTNGKSSTTHFTGELLTAAGRSAFVGGNLGTPLSVLAQALHEGGVAPDFAVVEVSSYQLELPGRFAPRAAVVLNLTPDHLARHGTMENYGATKLRIFARMGAGDSAVLPPGHPQLPTTAVPAAATALLLGGAPGARWDGDTLWLAGTVDDGPVPCAGFGMPGAHNRENLAAAILLAVQAGVPRADLRPEALTALPHRMEAVQAADGVLWINDSKATNVDAARVGYAGVEAPCIALLGGQGKEGADYAPLRPLLAHRARLVITFGASGPQIAEALAGLPLAAAPGLRDAVALARSAARPGDTILLSPACASFDEFRSFEHRGDVFRALARGQENA